MRFSITAVAFIALAAFNTDAAAIPRRSLMAEPVEVPRAEPVAVYKRVHPRDFGRRHLSGESMPIMRSIEEERDLVHDAVTHVVARAVAAVFPDIGSVTKRVHPRDFRVSSY